MERSDFVDRNGERKVDFLQYYGLIERVYSKEHGLTVAEMRLLIYLDAIPYFTRADFLDGTLFYTWDNKRFDKLQKGGWIATIKYTRKVADARYHYNLSLKGKRMVNSIYKILCGEIELPDKFKRKRESNKTSFTENAVKDAIDAMKKSKARDRLDDY